MEMEDRTLDAVDTVVFELLGPRRCRSEVKGSDLASASSHELQAESGTHKPQPTGHHEGVPLYAFVLAQVHFLSLRFVNLLTKIVSQTLQFTSRRRSLSCWPSLAWPDVAVDAQAAL
jgi:hypothetical protein